MCLVPLAASAFGARLAKLGARDGEVKPLRTSHVLGSACCFSFYARFAKFGAEVKEAVGKAVFEL